MNPDIKALVAALRTQRQIDSDGSVVAVSRQAVDEAADMLDKHSELAAARITELQAEKAGLESVVTAQAATIAELRSAPIAAQEPANSSPVDWQDAQRITDLPEVDELLQGFAEDPTGDAGTMIVRAVMQAVRQPAEPVKGPSDEVLMALRHAQTALEPSTDTVSKMVLNELRSVITRYGNTAQPAASAEPVDIEELAFDCGGTLASDGRFSFSCAAWHKFRKAAAPVATQASDTFRLLVAACSRLSADAEEYELDDGMGRAAILDSWHGFEDALEVAENELFSAVPADEELVEIDIDRVLSIADVHADESREDGVRLFDRSGLFAFAQDVLRVAAPPAAGQMLSPSESVFAFAAWLTCRQTPVTISGAHDAGIAAELADAFTRSQNMNPPREAYPKLLRPYPAEALQQDADKVGAQECNHVIADMTNKHVISGFMCVSCGALFKAADKGDAQTFQARVQPWMLECFGPAISADREERNHRFLEEALELVQACGCSTSEAHQLVDYVFGRPVGEPYQEAGGVMVTLAALCLANELDMHAAGETELARIWTMVDQIRAKQAAKPKHSPLPVATAQPGPATDGDVLGYLVGDYFYPVRILRSCSGNTREMIEREGKPVCGG